MVDSTTGVAAPPTPKPFANAFDPVHQEATPTPESTDSTAGADSPDATGPIIVPPNLAKTDPGITRAIASANDLIRRYSEALTRSGPADLEAATLPTSNDSGVTDATGTFGNASIMLTRYYDHAKKFLQYRQSLHLSASAIARSESMMNKLAESGQQAVDRLDQLVQQLNGLLGQVDGEGKIPEGSPGLRGSILDSLTNISNYITKTLKSYDEQWLNLAKQVHEVKGASDMASQKAKIQEDVAAVEDQNKQVAEQIAEAKEYAAKEDARRRENDQRNDAEAEKAHQEQVAQEQRKQEKGEREQAQAQQTVQGLLGQKQQQAAQEAQNDAQQHLQARAEKQAQQQQAAAAEANKQANKQKKEELAAANAKDNAKDKGGKPGDRDPRTMVAGTQGAQGPGTEGVPGDPHAGTAARSPTFANQSPTFANQATDNRSGMENELGEPNPARNPARLGSQYVAENTPEPPSGPYANSEPPRTPGTPWTPNPRNEDKPPDKPYSSKEGSDAGDTRILA